MPETTTTTERLGEMREAVKNARARVEQLEGEQRRTRRLVSQAEAALGDYFEQLAAGERAPDPDVEQRLAGELRRVQESIATRPVMSGDRFSHVEVYSVRVEGELRGARRSLVAAEAELLQYVEHNRVPLVVERKGDAEKVARRLIDLAAQLEATWSALMREEHEVLQGLGVDPDELPPRPFSAEIEQRLASDLAEERRM